MLDFFIPRFSEPVSTVVPNPRPALFLRVWRSGGTALNRVLDAPLITVEGWGDDSTDALRITSEAQSHILNGHRALRYVRRVVEVGGVHSMPDPETDTPRYRFTCSMHVRRPRT